MGVAPSTELQDASKPSNNCKRRENDKNQYNGDEYVTFGYIRMYYENKYHNQVPTPLKMMIYKILRQFEIILLHKYSKHSITTELRPNDCWKFGIVVDLLEVQCRGDVMMHKNGDIVLNDNTYSPQNLNYRNLKMNIDGHLYLQSEAKLFTEIQEKGGVIDIECDYLNMDHESGIIACGNMWNGKININIRKQLIVNNTPCHIKSNGDSIGGDICMNIGEGIKGDGLIIDVGGCTETGNFKWNNIAKCDGGYVDLNWRKYDGEAFKIEVYGGNNGELYCNQKVYHVNKLTISNGGVYWKLRH